MNLEAQVVIVLFFVLIVSCNFLIFLDYDTQLAILL